MMSALGPRVCVCVCVCVCVYLFIHMEACPFIQHPEVYILATYTVLIEVITFEQNQTEMTTILLILCLFFQVGTPDILKPLSPESPRRPTSPVLKQEDISSSPVLNTLFSGGLRQVSLI